MGWAPDVTALGIEVDLLYSEVSYSLKYGGEGYLRWGLRRSLVREDLLLFIGIRSFRQSMLNRHSISVE
jgi:hypothetical protein